MNDGDAYANAYANDANQLRNRGYEDRDDLSRLNSPQSSNEAALTAITQTVTTYPTTPSASYAVREVVTTCAETEGATPTFAAVGSIFYAVNLGAAIPPTSTVIEIVMKDSLWQFTYG